MYKKIAVAASLSLAFCQTAVAADVFTVAITVNGTTITQGFNITRSSFDATKPDNIKALFPAFDKVVDPGSIALDFRGLGLNLQYLANSPTLTMSIPAIGVNQTFAGATRDESNAMMDAFFKKNGGTILNELMKKLAEVSPVDPIAGNPNSLQSQLAASDFDKSFTSFASNIKTPQSNTATSTPNLIGFGLRFGSYDINSRKSDSYTIPLSYSFRSDLDPRRQLTISMPITTSDVQGAKSYSTGLGISYRFPVNDNWALSPAANIAAAGSIDLASAAAIASASLTSSYIINGSDYDIAIGNMVGYYETLKIQSGDYSYDPGIKNTIFRNGVMLSQPINAFGKDMSIEYSLVDTRFTGTALYIKGYDEIGVTLGTNKSASSSRNYLRAGVSYLFSPKSKGFTANLGYWF